MARRRRNRQGRRWIKRGALAVLAIPALYLLAALIGSLVPVNRGWTEAERGTSVYLADNGIHADLIMPVRAQGLDWAPLIPRRDLAAPPAEARWIAFGSGAATSLLGNSGAQSRPCARTGIRMSAWTPVLAR